MTEQSITPSAPSCPPPLGGSWREAIFPGSFDPFTIGHADIVRRGLQLFDAIVVAVGYNAQKTTGTPVAERVAAIARIYKDEPRVKVVSYSDLTVDLAEREDARFLLRGVRSVKDFEYERDLAAVNAAISPAATPALETVLLIADPRYAHISSSVVRELKAYGRDVTPYLP